MESLAAMNDRIYPDGPFERLIGWSKLPAILVSGYVYDDEGLYACVMGRKRLYPVLATGLWGRRTC